MKNSLINRTGVLVYGAVCYAIFLGVFLYAIGFIGNFLVPTTLDGPATTSTMVAIFVNLTLLGIFAVQHSGMARPPFKRWLTNHIPEAAERSTYVLLSSIAMILLFVFWQPIGGDIWRVESAVGIVLLYSLFAVGWVVIFVSTCLIDHFDLFGLRQPWNYFRARQYQPPKFQTPGPYKMIRHPLYVGWLLTFWATPTMTSAHLVFALGCTIYILIAIQLEERDLIDFHGNAYLDYQLKVPMLVPRISMLSAADERSARAS